MQLTVRDVSKFLNIAESTVSRWIKRRGLPANYVNGRYHFSRSELLEWATANPVKVSVEMFDQLKPDDEPVPSLAEALEAGGIFYQLQDTSRDEALRALVQALPVLEGMDRELLFRLFVAREESASTAIGNGIALPHVRHPNILHVARPTIVLCFLKNPVDFRALDGTPVKVLFSLVCPTMHSHLQMLARLAHVLHDPQFRDVVMREGQREEILQACRRAEAALATRPAEAGTV
jgi:PTS system nitrogen regulatory IIA component